MKYERSKNAEHSDEGYDYFTFKGIKISDIDIERLELLVARILSSQRCGYFCLTDVGNLMMAQNDIKLAFAINQSTLSLADGTPLEWYGKMIGHRQVQRISGVYLFQHLLHYTNYRHFLLGDTVGMQKKVIQRAKLKKPDVQIDCYSPPFKSRFSEMDNQMILSKIDKSRADIIWVSFGGGKQEKWMLQNMPKLKRGILIGVGAAFRFYTGDLFVPPPLIQRLGLQWTTRLFKNPLRWMTHGQFKYRVLFSLSFPREIFKAHRLNRFQART